MTERSILRVRAPDHINPNRKGELIVEVVRGGEVVATIYGSREGIHVVSDRALENGAFLAVNLGPAPSWVMPLLAKDEPCPWCSDERYIDLQGERVPCPVCAGRRL